MNKTDDRHRAAPPLWRKYLCRAAESAYAIPYLSRQPYKKGGELVLDLKEAMEAVMSGREERSAEQSCMLSSGAGRFVCQISLNVPGFPKRLDGDEALIEKIARDLIKKNCCPPLSEAKLENGAGLALLMLFDGGYAAARGVKLAGISIEENSECGRIADIDVITEDGALSRSDLGFSPRQCLLCGGVSKECARERRHTYEELRTKIRSFLGEFCSQQE